MIHKGVIFLCILLGLWLRFDCYRTVHPDNDELYELRNLKADVRLSRVLDRKEHYGDHTSFPGEMLIYYPVMSRMNWKGVVLEIENMKVTGMTIGDFWKLASVKIFVTVVGMVVLGWMLCRVKFGWIGMFMYASHYQLVYHAFEMRPYAVLPELAILTYFLCDSYFKKQNLFKFIVLGGLIFFTCIYHAYGILIAGLPILYCVIKYKKWSWAVGTVFLISAVAWSYYASYSLFGMTPNEMQAQVNPFEYMPIKGFGENLVRQLTGGSLVFYILSPLLFLSLLKAKTDDWIFLGIFIILPIFLICSVDIKTNYWIHPRQYCWVIPWFIIFCVKKVGDIV
jgi:hypothetical protein